MEYEKDPKQFQIESQNVEVIKQELKLIVDGSVPSRNVTCCVTLEICDNPPANGCNYECMYALVSLYGYSTHDFESINEGSSLRFFNLLPAKSSDDYSLKLKSTKSTRFIVTPTNTEEKYIIPRKLCRVSELANSGHTVDFVGIIISVLCKQFNDSFVYHLLLSDESREKVIVKVDSVTKKDNLFNLYQPLLFLNLKHVYNCKRYRKLNALKYTEFHKRPCPQYSKTRRLKELQAFISREPDLKVKAHDYLELLNEVALGCPEQIISQTNNTRSIIPFDSMANIGNTYYFGPWDDMIKFHAENGFIFRCYNGDSVEYLSFDNNMYIQLLTILLTNAEIEELVNCVQQNNDEFKLKREKAIIWAELGTDISKLVFMLENGKTFSQGGPCCLVPFTIDEWNELITSLSKLLSNKPFAVTVQDNNANCKYCTSIKSCEFQ